MRQAILAGLALVSSGCDNLDIDLDSEEIAPSAGPIVAGSGVLAPPPPEPAPPGVTIEKITTGGSGCSDPGSLTVTIDAEGTAFLAIFDRMTLSYPPGSPVQHVSCIANLKVSAPAGWRFTVEDATTRGYAYLSDRQSAMIASKYFFSGASPGRIVMSTIDGPHDGDFAFTDPTPTVGWSKCGGQNVFHLHTMLTLNVVKNRDDPAVLNSETADGRLVKSLGWKWERC